MEINGIAFALLDIPQEYTEEYNRWYDLDHLAEHAAKGDVVMARRYVRPATHRKLPGVQTSEFVDGYPPYLTIYSFGGPLDFEGDEARAGWRDTDRVIVKAGRYWKAGRGRHNSRWRLAQSTGSPSVHVVPRAIPYVAHRGVIAAVGKAPSPERRQEAIDWWNEVHLVDLFAVPGVLAATRYESVDPAQQDLLLHIILCEDPVADVMARIEHSRRYTRAIGRYPAHGGVYESMVWLPFDRIVPLEYDFDIGPSDAAG